MNYADYEYLLSATLLVFAMFGMGATLTPREFYGVARAPQGVLLILFVQVVVTPALALLLGRLFRTPREIVIGMLVYAALPGGMFSNIFTYLGRGNVALSVSATSFSSLACLATTTFVVKTFGSTQMPADFAMPVTHILLEIGGCLILPLVVGMAFRRLAPERSATVAKLCVRTSIVLLLLVIIAALSAGRIQPSSYGWRTPAALVLMMLTSVWVCHLGGRLLRMHQDDIFAAAIEVVMRNAHLGVLLKASLFPSSDPASRAIGDGVLFVVLFAGAAALVMGGFEAIGKRRGLGAYRLDPEPDPPTSSDPQASDQPASAPQASSENKSASDAG